MQIIRTAQLRAMQQAMDRRFLQALAHRVQARFPTHPATASQASLLLVLEAFVAEASGYGMTSEAALVDYVGVKFDVGFAFDRHPLVTASLALPIFDSNLLAQRLFLSFADDDWRRIRAACAD